MRSMTGYGKGIAAIENTELTIELKSVNSRFVEINSRLPKMFAAFDMNIRKQISQGVKRGTIDVYFNYLDKSDKAKPVFIDLQLARSYIAAAKKLRAEFLLDDDFQLTALMKTQDIVRIDFEEADDEVKSKLITKALTEAIENLDKMKLAEGANLQLDLINIMTDIAQSLKKIEERAPLIVEEYRAKISLRIKQILESVPLDENKLANETAFFADKCDVNEEIARLKSHISQFNACLKSDGEQGRKLDFICQEMMREANTIGSKSSDITNTNLVIAIKNSLEKLKEQIRNVE